MITADNIVRSVLVVEIHYETLWSTHSDPDYKPFEICLNYAIDQKYILKLYNTEFVIHSNKISIKNAN